jgi:hypothetical protein
MLAARVEQHPQDASHESHHNRHDGTDDELAEQFHSVPFRVNGGTRTRNLQSLRLAPLPNWATLTQSLQSGLNGRPAPYEDAALPLSYGGRFSVMPGCRHGQEEGNQDKRQQEPGLAALP